MTKEELKEIVRVCGKDFNCWNIPTYIRVRDARAIMKKRRQHFKNPKTKIA